MNGMKPKRTRGFDIWQGVIDEQAFARLPPDPTEGEQEDGWVWFDEFVFAGDDHFIE